MHTGALGQADSDAEPGPVGPGRGLCVSIEPQAAGGGPRAEQPGPRASAEALGSRQRPRGSWTTTSQQSQGGVAWGGGKLWGPLHAWTPQSSDLGSRTVKGEEAACSYGTGR